MACMITWCALSRGCCCSVLLLLHSDVHSWSQDSDPSSAGWWLTNMNGKYRTPRTKFTLLHLSHQVDLFTSYLRVLHMHPLYHNCTGECSPAPHIGPFTEFPRELGTYIHVWTIVQRGRCRTTRAPPTQPCEGNEKTLQGHAFWCMQYGIVSYRKPLFNARRYYVLVLLVTVLQVGGNHISNSRLKFNCSVAVQLCASI